MGVILAFLMLFQAVATPVGDGSLVVSSGGVEFPELPEGIESTPINQDWELLYYTIYTTSNDHMIRGEIRNISDNPLSTPTLIVTMADGLQIGIHPDIDRVDPGGRAPFLYVAWEDEVTSALNQSRELAFTDTCEFYRVVPGQEFAWEFDDVEIEFEPERAAVQVSGSVTQVSDGHAERYRPMLFGFNADGEYLGSISGDAPETIFSGDQFEFEMNHGFGTYNSNDPFSGARRDPQFVLAMAPPTIAYTSCI